jgi:hypothetical protein
MAKKYTRKQVSSMDDLDVEQERIHYKLKRLEDDALELFSPQQLAITLIGKLLTRKSSAKPQQYFYGTPQKKKGNGKRSSLKGAAANAIKNPLVRKVARKVGISFLQWQAFNLALFLGKKLWKRVQEKRHGQKLSRAAS